MKVIAIAVTDLRRLLRWRANVFFLFVLPMLIILLLGAAFGGSRQARIGVAGGREGVLAVRFLAALSQRESVELTRFASAESLAHAVSHGDVDAGIVIPGDYDAHLGAAPV
jgi:linearmycin/streptolysin S transport system permease protein